MTIMQIIILQLSFLVSGVVFAYPLEKKEPFKKRFLFTSGVMLAILWVLLCLDAETLLLGFVLKVVLCAVMAVYIYTCWDCHWTVALYDAIWAASVWQLLLEEWEIIQCFMGEDNKHSGNQLLMVLVGFFLIIHLLLGTTIAKWMPKDRKDKLGPRQTTSAILIFFLIQITSIAPVLQEIQSGDDNWKVFILSQIICLVILYMQNELFKKSDIKRELELMNLLWEKEKEQYQLNRENIALINQKCHDLKHQIRALRHTSKEEYEQYLKEMEESVLIYEAIVKTGNEVFDTILTEKSLYCKDREIQVTCVADGNQMDFINTVDLYAILGNAMDNAIEAVEKFEEKEKRQIDIMIYRQQNFLVMNVINPLPEKLVYEEELPVSTKGDKDFHGFGLRSMRYIAKKYDGFVNISEEDGCFSLKILIPIPTSTTT